MNTIAPPLTMPARAPCQLERLQNRAKRTTGPNTAPKPAHAKDTMLNTELSGSLARNAAITEISTRVMRSANMLFFLEEALASTLPRRSEDTAEEAARSCESAVDIVEARIPARIVPARNAGRIPYVLNRSEICTMIVSESEPESTASAPASLMARPITPINTATASEITTHVVATLLEREKLVFIFDRHETKKDMRHTEVSQSPCDHGYNIDEWIRLLDAGYRIICSRHGQISRQGLCVLDNSRNTAGNVDAEDEHNDQGNGHDDALDKVGRRRGEEAS